MSSLPAYLPKTTLSHITRPGRATTPRKMTGAPASPSRRPAAVGSGAVENGNTGRRSAKADGANPKLSADPLFQPLQLGPYNLEHRVVYAPLTRCRAIGSVPQPNMATYYAQRASKGGLMISEATCISERAFGQVNVPGIFTPTQIQGWRPVVEAVHAKGGVFFCQLWHVGRASHPDYQPNGDLPVSPSALPITNHQVYSPTAGKLVDFPAPRALEAYEIPGIVRQYREAARNAVAAGFDGVEIHGANGYLIDQFLKDECNKRTDEYGGPIENRCRFALEVVQQVCEEVGADRVGIRLSPFGYFQSAADSHPFSLTTYLLEELNRYGLAYVHAVEPRVRRGSVGWETISAPEARGEQSLAPFRQVYKGTFISAGGHDRETGIRTVATGRADMVAYGRFFISNPDLPRRLQLGAPLAPYDRATFYTGGDRGYTDYPEYTALGA